MCMSSNSEEPSTNIITFHLGEKSCHVGAHLYNRQHRSTFHSSETPRALFVDFKHNISNSVDQENIDEADALWDEKVQKLVTYVEPIKPVDCYSSNVDLKWGRNLDFRLRDRSVIDLPYCNKFDSFLTGYNFYKTHGLDGRFEDHLRYFAEGCDSLQGFITVCDINSGYSGFIPPLYALIDDSYGNKARLTLPLCEDEQTLSVFDLDGLLSSGACSLLSLISKNHEASNKLKYILNSGSTYHTTALLSIVLSQIMDPLCSGTHLKEFSSSLTPVSRNLFSSALSVPFSTHLERSISDPIVKLLTEDYFTKSVASLTPSVESVQYPLCYTYLSMCGVPNVENNSQFFSQLSGLSSTLFSSTTRYVYSGEPMRLSRSFPQFFNCDILSNGSLRKEYAKNRTQPVTSLPVMLCLQNNKECANIIDSTLEQKMSRSVEMISAGVLEDDFNDAKQRLFEISDNYKL